jgi:hypothetical protein
MSDVDAIPSREPLESFVKSWKDGPAEVRRRVWEWWQAKHDCGFPCFENAVLLVATVQISSACVERLFSDVNRILDLAGECALRDSMEGRCNTNMARSSIHTVHTIIGRVAVASRHYSVFGGFSSMCHQAIWYYIISCHYDNLCTAQVPYC